MLASPTINSSTALPQQIKSYITINFSQDMNPSLAQNLRNYQVHQPCGTHSLKTRSVRTIPIRMATYLSATRSVILGSVYRLNPRLVYQLTVKHRPRRTRQQHWNRSGRPAGQPGTDYTAFLK